jgi:hypothetical protein
VNRIDGRAARGLRASACDSTAALLRATARRRRDASGQEALAARTAQAARFGNPESGFWQPSCDAPPAEFEDFDNSRRSFELYSFDILGLYFKRLCLPSPIAKKNTG